jgi:reversibly glycosylated polypeptide/UDP-arabinopyranose mutase
MIHLYYSMNVFLVIPTIRSLDFLKEWEDQFSRCHIVIIEDHKHIEIPKPNVPCLGVYRYSWEDIARDFGKNEWIFPRHNAGIRSYGFWKAYTLKADIIITIDDDCYPTGEGFVKQHKANLQSRAPERWFSTFPHPGFNFTRGFPYHTRNKHAVAISHGLWSNKMDLDGKTQLSAGNVNIPPYPPLRQFVPCGYYFPMSSMNLAFVRNVIPLMYFLLMGFSSKGFHWGYDRFDDIWAGIFAKKILDHLGLAVVNGSPFVEHRKASDARANIEKEKTGIRVNEQLWKAADDVCLTKGTIVESYRELAEKINFPKKPYFDTLRRAMIMWSELFLSI